MLSSRRGSEREGKTEQAEGGCRELLIAAGAGKERTSGREQGKRGGTNEVDLLVGSLVESFS